MVDVRKMVAIAFFGTILAVTSNSMRAKPLPWVIDSDTNIRDKKVAQKVSVTLAEVRTHLSNYDATFIDARRPDQFEAGHLPGAYNVPVEGKESAMAQIWQNVPPSGLVIIYCDGGNCDASKNIYEYLTANGFTNLRLFEGGWAEIEPSDLPRETGPRMDPSAPQDPGADPAMQGDSAGSDPSAAGGGGS